MTRRIEMRSVLTITLAVSVILIASFAQGGAQQTPQAQEQSKAVRAVGAMRAINTAEVYYQRANGRFGTFGELVSSGQFAALKGSWGEPFANADAAKPEEDAVPGYKLRLVVANGGASYSVRLVDAGSCEASFFSDEAGVIFLGQPIGCETSGKQAR